MIYVILIILLSLLLFFLFRFLSYIVASCILPSKRAPTISSFDSDLKIMKKLKLDKGKKILDLGCANGKALRFFESEFDLLGEGYDINFFAIKFGRLLNKINKSKVKLFWKNFFDAKLSEYDYIYLYLLPEQMENIEDWIWKNISKNTIIISNTFQFKKNQPFDILKTDKGKSRIYLYKRGSV